MKKKSLTKRQQQAIETKNIIYNAAIELMDAEGFDNITIADISEKAGVSVGSFYHYFKSKHDILAEIFHKGDEYFLENVKGKLKSRTSRDKILEFFEHYARFNVLTTVETASQLYNPKVKFFIEKNRPMISLIEEIIQEGVDSGQLITHWDVWELVRMLIIFSRGIVFDWSLHDGDYDLEETMNSYMRLFVEALLPNAPSDCPDR